VRIDPPDPRDKVHNAGSVRKRPAPESGGDRDGPSVEDQIALAQIHNMVDQLISQPEVRQEMVDLGKRLVADPSYPPNEVVERVAQILARAMRAKAAT
jgi:hypothetical protein